MTRCLQERYAPHNACFGCGPANPRGLRIRSFPAAELADPPEGTGALDVVCEWTSEPHHAAFEGVLNGGIVGTLLDCHGNWTAAWHLMRAAGADAPPCTVTAEYTIRMKRPTPTGVPLLLVARVVEAGADRATVEGEIRSGGRVTATCHGLFVAVKPGHPAYHRW
jgi:acyl-coenzyme A thioesterase PaaI-like protein